MNVWWTGRGGKRCGEGGRVVEVAWLHGPSPLGWGGARDLVVVVVVPRLNVYLCPVPVVSVYVHVFMYNEEGNPVPDGVDCGAG